MKSLTYFLERNAFGVCARLGEKLGISSESIRLSFVYTSFLTLGSPVVVYLTLAFWMHMRQHLRRYRASIRGL
ncbi:MAG: PspC family transcriptional regulator [Bernardetiaceae bacterium]|nr:PspC family transcriptional regulator [Bernardetiaceae bacterium]